MNEDSQYKYLDINGALSMIMHRELQFTNPEYFNDPFDCHPGLLDYEVPEGYTNGWPPKTFLKDKAENDSVNNRRRAWVCSLAKSNDSMLMWSYYTNHKGVCIGLKKEALTKTLSKGDLGMMVFTNQDIQYREILEKPNSFRSAKDTFVYQLCTKSVQWQHEQEVRHIILDPHPWIPYRMVRQTSKEELIPCTEVRFYPYISADCFDSIYLGVRINESDKLRILKAVKQYLPGVKVFQMTPDQRSFSFIEEPVDVELFLESHKETPSKTILSRIRSWSPFHIKITSTRPTTVKRRYRL